MESAFSIRNIAPESPVTEAAIRILTRILKERANISLRHDSENPDLELAVEPREGKEGFTIDNNGQCPRITGHDPRGLLYGIGKFLHTGSWSATGFTPGAWQGTSVPDCSMRGIYIANNFNNWNYSCPVADMKNYLDELSLWGMNMVAFNFVQYANLPEPKRGQYLARNREIIAHANSIGMRVTLLYAPNMGFGPIPAAIRAHPFPDTSPARRGGGDNPVSFVCPSNPEGHAFIMRRIGEDMDCYKGLQIDAIATFPYDAGGCGCEKCWPWGARGFPALSRDVITMAREKWPACKLILCTWCYDVREESDGEYEGLDKLLSQNNDWCDVIMADAHGSFPRYPLDVRVPGGLPMINFAEISMWGRFPWGGSGANPFPARIVSIWNAAKHLLDGGLPYSEGRFEDINKVACLSLFWNKNASAEEIVRDYANFEYGPETPDAIWEAIQILEQIYPTPKPDAAKAEKALSILKATEKTLTKQAKSSWRWRILLLRAIIDAENAKAADNTVSSACNAAYEELTSLYCAERAGGPVAPRSKSFYARDDIETKGPVFAEHIGEHASNADQIN